MKQIPTGPILLATATACAGIAFWALRPASAPDERASRRERGTSSSVALEPPYSRLEVKVVQAPAARLEAPLAAGEADGASARPSDAPEQRPVAAAVSSERDEAANDAAAAAARAKVAAAREARAISALRAIAAAQAQLQGAAAIDTDADGTGEFGYLAELAGVRPLRKHDPAAGAVLGGPADVLEPALLAGEFARLATVSGNGVVTLEGYHFLVYLPDGSADTAVGGLPEGATGGAGDPLPGAANAETLWCCYAWPADDAERSLRTFFVNQQGDVLACGGDSTRAMPYAGVRVPRFDAALASAAAGDMRQALGSSALGQSSNDGQVWAPVGR